MGRPLIYDVIDKPITAFVISFCSIIWFMVQKNRIGYQDVGLNYISVLEDGEYWRIISAAFTHISFLHLVFNMTALWSLGPVEVSKEMGELFYFRNTLLLIVLSGILVLATYHLLVVYCRREHFMRVSAVGYSCVVFGWMTIVSVKQPSMRLDIFGLFNLPIALAPFESLVITSIMVPQASFVGHLAGIIAGYILSLGFMQDLNLYWCTVFSLGILYHTFENLKRTRPNWLPQVSYECDRLESIVNVDSIV